MWLNNKPVYFKLDLIRMDLSSLSADLLAVSSVADLIYTTDPRSILNPRKCLKVWVEEEGGTSCSERQIKSN